MVFFFSQISVRLLPHGEEFMKAVEKDQESYCKIYLHVTPLVDNKGLPPFLTHPTAMVSSLLFSQLIKVNIKAFSDSGVALDLE